MISSVTEVPPFQNRHSYVENDCRRFAASDDDCVEISYVGKSALQITRNVSVYLARHPELSNISVHTKSGHTYLVKKEVLDGAE